MTRHLIFLAHYLLAASLVIFFVGCASHASPAKAQGVLCEVQANPAAFVGKEIFVDGDFQTDHMTFGFVEAGNCGMRGTISTGTVAIGDPALGADSSVTDFLNSVSKRCSGFCYTGARISMTGIIGVTSSGGLVLRPKRVMDYEFVR